MRSACDKRDGETEGRRKGDIRTYDNYGVGDSIADGPKNVTPVNDFSVSADSLDLGEVKEVQAKPKTAPVSSQTAEADELG